MGAVPVLLLVVMVAALAGVPAAAQTTVYRCTDAQGRVTYQAGVCHADGAAGASRELHLPRNPPANPQAAPAAAAQTAPAASPVAAVTLYYDPANEPMEHPSAKMEAYLNNAMRAWAAGCKVELRYGGRAPYSVTHSAPGTPQRVSVRWMPEYLATRHPADAGFGLAGTGSMRAGIGLSTRLNDVALQSTLTHELGHVLGLGHNHTDQRSVMSYLRDAQTRRSAQPSASDYLACNLSMKKLFGIEFSPPADAPAPVAGPRMSDREALETLRRRASP